MIFPLGFFGHGPKQPKLSTPWNFRSPSVQGLGEPRLRTLLFFQGKRADTGQFPDSLAQSKLWESAACPFFSPHKFHSFWHSEAVDLLLFSEVVSFHFFVPPLFPFYSANNTLCISRELLDFPGGSSGKELAYQCRRPKSHRFDPWMGKIPWRRAWQPPPVFLPGESHGQRSLVGYSPWGCKDTTEVT